MKTVRLFPSFSGLLLLLKNGLQWVDGEDCMYSFGCTREGIVDTLSLYDREHELDWEGLLMVLDHAEAEGRCLWRNERMGSGERMMWLVLHLRMMGVEVAEPVCDDEYSNAGIYLPALARWLAKNAPSVVMVDREFGVSK